MKTEINFTQCHGVEKYENVHSSEKLLRNPEEVKVLWGSLSKNVTE